MGQAMPAFFSGRDILGCPNKVINVKLRGARSLWSANRQWGSQGGGFPSLDASDPDQGPSADDEALLFLALNCNRHRLISVLRRPLAIFSKLPLGDNATQRASKKRVPVAKHCMELRSFYLLCYNAVQFYFWSQVLLKLASTTASTISGGAEHVPESLFNACIPYAHRGQSLAWMEVLHAAVGLVGGGAPAALVQCLGRYVVLVEVVEPIHFMHNAWVSVVMILVWSVGDVVRYAFYICSIVGGQWAIMLWIRYSLFLVLYPIGIVSEWLVYFFTLGYVDETDMYAVKLPNSWNFAFNFGVWNRFVLLLYFYFGPFMFMHMLRQRKKKLHTSRP